MFQRCGVNSRFIVFAVALFCVASRDASALDPQKALTQYSRTLWTQEHGLPQDSITAIAQTTDGYLWLGTDEGLARFDGYEFIKFNKASGDLPSNSITALTAASDGSLWIGTTDGLARYANHQFHTYTLADGFSDNSIASLCIDHAGNLWIAADGRLVGFDGKKFTVFASNRGSAITARTVYEDRHNIIWVAGFGGVGQWSSGKFLFVIDSATLGDNLITRVLEDKEDNVWLAGNRGILRRSPDGTIRRFDRRDGLPDEYVRSLWLDTDGSLWAGTNSGLARLAKDRFVADTGTQDRQDPIRCLFEDAEGNLWVGASSGLTRLRDDLFTVYGKSEGLPSDNPNSVYKDRLGRLFVGFKDSGLMLFSTNGRRQFTRLGPPNIEVLSIRESQNGDLLLGTREGLVRMHGAQFSAYNPPDELARKAVFDALEDSKGRLWLALPSGLGELRGGELHFVLPGGPQNSAVVTLQEGTDGVLWAGTYRWGLWRIGEDSKRLLTTHDGLSSDNIRALSQDRDGTLWIATFGGGLNVLLDGAFVHFTEKDGLLSDNIYHIIDDGDSLWLNTTRGVCRVSKHQLFEFANHKIQKLNPINYGVKDGLRSVLSLPGQTVTKGGYRSSDGQIWIPTNDGLAVIDVNAPPQRVPLPSIHLVNVSADNRPLGLLQGMRISPSIHRIEIQYAALHLRAPESVQYSHKLEGLDTDWVQSGNNRVVTYYNLAPRKYRLVVRATLPNGAVAENAYSFEKLPEFYETGWFRLLLGIALALSAWAAYKLHLRQIRYRFSLVLEERTRLAREIHDTLAQSFVGISSQLDAVALGVPEEQVQARAHLDVARRMSRHSLTEARRSIMDLRALEPEEQGFAAALQSGVPLWTAGSAVAVEMNLSELEDRIPKEFQKPLLRIVQEAIANVLKHADASRIWIQASIEARKLHLRVIDDGRGFEQKEAFCSSKGHFGLIGMRERVERIGGELSLSSHAGEGTQIEVMVPLP
jgi:signal transduction histidine kinase/ligand-binding sensor domain-containing protein